MTKTEVASILAICAAAYPHVAVTKETAIIYADLLADIDLMVAQRAVKRLIATSQYFPTVAAIREQCASIISPSAPTGATAWAEVTTKIREFGHGTQPDWSHPSVASTVNIIGWRELCMSENQAVTRAHFWKVHEAVAREHKQQAVLPPEFRAIGQS